MGAGIGVSNAAECCRHRRGQPPSAVACIATPCRAMADKNGSCIRISAPLGAERIVELSDDPTEAPEVLMARPWSFDRMEESWVYLRHSATRLRIRFWPYPRVEISESGGGWADASLLGDAFLARSGFFRAVKGYEVCLVGVRPLTDYLGTIDDTQLDRLPLANYECVLADGNLVLIDGRRQACFPFELLARDGDRVWKMTSALDLAVACIPQGIRSRLPYFEGSPWALLHLAARHREVRDLMVSNSMLLNLWLRRVEWDVDRFEKEAFPFLGLQQREQFAVCCECNTDQPCVNILRKIPVKEMCFIPDVLVQQLS